MNTKETNTDNLVTVSEAGLLALVAAKLEGIVLFPEKIEEAKAFFANIEKSVL